MAYDGLRWHANGSVSGSKNETEHLEDAPHYESHRRYDGMRYRVEQHEEKAKYDHSTFDFTIQHGASPEARFYLQSYKNSLKYASFRPSFCAVRCFS